MFDDLLIGTGSSTYDWTGAGTSNVELPAIETQSDSFWTGGNIMGIANAGIGIWSGISSGNTAKDIANKQLEAQRLANEGIISQGQLALEIERLKLEALKLEGGEAKDNTLLYVGLGLGGLLVLGGVIWAVTKK
jgi:hypothetical protein